MKNFFLSTILSLSFISTFGQLSFHGVASATSPIGLTTTPYSHNFFDVGVLAGAELGYRFAKRIELRIFYTAGFWDDHGISGAGSITTDYQNYGVKPQFNILSSKRKVVFLDLATPFSIVTQKSIWHSSENFFFPVFGHTSKGEDRADFFRFGIAPRLRLAVKKARLNFELGPTLNFDKLRSAHRTVHIDTDDNYFQNVKTQYRDISYDFQVNIGYSFW